MNLGPLEQTLDFDCIVFTDGACSGNPGPGGWACIIVTAGENVTELGGFDPSTTNNRMELTAVCVALESVAIRSTVKLFTDSTYVIYGATQWIWGWEKRGWRTADDKDVANKDLWIRLKAALQRVKVKWGYVRGHSGHPGNDRCDQIAVAFSKGDPISLYRGSLSDYSILITDPPEVPLPKNSDFKNKQKSTEKVFYLSFVDRELRRHETWAECQNRVAGRSSARFKKVKNQAELEAVCKEWGIDPSGLKSN